MLFFALHTVTKSLAIIEDNAEVWITATITGCKEDGNVFSYAPL